MNKVKTWLKIGRQKGDFKTEMFFMIMTMTILLWDPEISQEYLGKHMKGTW